MNSKNLTDKENKILIELYPDSYSEDIAKKLNKSTSAIYNQAHKLGLKKSKEFLQNQVSLKKLAILGKKYRFKKGNIPANKGMKQEDFMTPEGIENSKKTRLKKGNIPYNTKEDGYISIRKDTKGNIYKYIRTSKGNFVLLHRYKWEEVNGKIPKGMILVCKDKNTLNCEPENWELITLEENMKRNTIHNYPEDIKKTIRVLTKLKKTIKNYGTE